MIHTLSRDAFFELAMTQTDTFMRSIDAFDLYVVKQYYPKDKMLAFRQFLREFAQSKPASWHPCLDGCPDYHRINDEYAKSWVKARMHQFFFHRWNENKAIFDNFKDIFKLKNHLAGESPDAYYDNIPSNGLISRVVVQTYPCGGGYQQEHIDPHGPFALIQTIIMASQPGQDYYSGGFYYRLNEGEPAVSCDHLLEMGDMLVASPAVRHGVATVDADTTLDWDKLDGRYTIIPIILRSDYNADPSLKPKGLG